MQQKSDISHQDQDQDHDCNFQSLDPSRDQQQGLKTTSLKHTHTDTQRKRWIHLQTDIQIYADKTFTTAMKTDFSHSCKEYIQSVTYLMAYSVSNELP